MKTNYAFSGIIFVAQGIISVIKNKGRKAYQKGDIIGLKQTLNGKKSMPVKLFPLSEVTLFVLEESTLRETMNSSPAIGNSLLRALTIYYSKTLLAKKEEDTKKVGESGTLERKAIIKSDIPLPNFNIIPKAKLNNEEEKLLSKLLENIKQEEIKKSELLATQDPKLSPRKTQRTDNIKIYKSSFLNWKISEQAEELRRKKLEKKNLSKKGGNAQSESFNGISPIKMNSATTELSKSTTDFAKSKHPELKNEDLILMKKHIESLRKEVEKMSVDIEKFDNERSLARKKYLDERNTRETLEVELKKICLMKDVENIREKRKKKEQEGENLRATFKTLNFGQIVFFDLSD